jgi:hypothetical protein
MHETRQDAALFLFDEVGVKGLTLVLYKKAFTNAVAPTNNTR